MVRAPVELAVPDRSAPYFGQTNPTAERTAAAFERLQRLASDWHEVDPSDAIREMATRLVRVHPLRAADAFQLAVAYVAAEQRPASLATVTLDARLAGAAHKEGFAVSGLIE
ncbi:MAG TPA: hypothetical protein VH678_04065 [Xanthobacteraceae bacterium]|jgi:hypothetical protein